MTWVNVHDVKLEVLHLTPCSRGKGPGRDSPTLVFLHEGLGSVALWHSKSPWWTQQLCDRLGLPGLVYSRLGYGQSDPIADVRSLNRHGPDYLHEHAWNTLPALLKATGVISPILVGHSDGATIALLHAARHPVRACVVMAPHVMVEPICIQSIQEAKQSFEHGDLRARLSRFHADVDSAFWQWCDVWLSEPFSHMDIRPDCNAITAPVLAIQGREDAYGTLAQIEQIQTAGPLERLVVESCGHSPHRDQPELCLDHICHFLQNLM